MEICTPPGKTSVTAGPARPGVWAACSLVSSPCSMKYSSRSRSTVCFPIVAQSIAPPSPLVPLARLISTGRRPLRLLVARDEAGRRRETGRLAPDHLESPDDEHHAGHRRL